MNNDLEFLKEMHELTQSLLKDRYDSVKVDTLNDMIEDWISDLSSQNNKPFVKANVSNRLRIHCQKRIMHED